MTTTDADIDQRARDYIDAVVEINRRHGGATLSHAEYEQAVQQAAAPARRLRRARADA